MFLLLVVFICIGSFLVGRCGYAEGSVVSLRAFSYGVVVVCLSAYEVLVCHFASRLLDAFCSSVFVVVEGAALS